MDNLRDSVISALVGVIAAKVLDEIVEHIKNRRNKNEPTE